MDFWDIFLGVLFLIICFLLIVIVLLQKGRGGGLGAAFGGMGSAAFGTKTGDVFTWVTIVLTGLFLVLAVVASLSFRPTPGTVFTPEFLPPPGPIAEPTGVTISCRTEGAFIRYTLDRTEPDEHSATYDKPVRVEPGDVLKARAFRESWTSSRVATALYTVADANAPRPGDANQPAARAATSPAAPSATKPAAPAGN